MGKYVFVSCDTCRRRKQACDSGKPVCSRCHVSGFDCTYSKESRRPPVHRTSSNAGGNRSLVRRSSFTASAAAGLDGAHSRYLLAFSSCFGREAIQMPQSQVAELFFSAKRSLRSGVSEETLLREGQACAVLAVGAVLSGNCVEAADHAQLILLANLKLQAALRAERPLKGHGSGGKGASLAVADDKAARARRNAQLTIVLYLESLYYLVTQQMEFFQECSRHALSAFSTGERRASRAKSAKAAEELFPPAFGQMRDYLQTLNALHILTPQGPTVSGEPTKTTAGAGAEASSKRKRRQRGGERCEAGAGAVQLVEGDGQCHQGGCGSGGESECSRDSGDGSEAADSDAAQQRPGDDWQTGLQFNEISSLHPSAVWSIFGSLAAWIVPYLAAAEGPAIAGGDTGGTGGGADSSVPQLPPIPLPELERAFQIVERCADRCYSAVEDVGLLVSYHASAWLMVLMAFMPQAEARFHSVASRWGGLFRISRDAPGLFGLHYDLPVAMAILARLGGGRHMHPLDYQLFLAMHALSQKNAQGMLVPTAPMGEIVPLEHFASRLHPVNVGLVWKLGAWDPLARTEYHLPVA